MIPIPITKEPITRGISFRNFFLVTMLSTKRIIEIGKAPNKKSDPSINKKKLIVHPPEKNHKNSILRKKLFFKLRVYKHVIESR